MKIEDNFLDRDKFIDLQILMTGTAFPWYFNDCITNASETVKETNEFQFTHTFYRDCCSNSQYFGDLKPILDKLNILALYRVKANLQTRTVSIEEHSLHVDVNCENLKMPKTRLKEITTAIFYMNSNDGYTKFEDGTVVESVGNRMLMFPANMKHTGTTCTDQKKRVVINFDFFK